MNQNDQNPGSNSELDLPIDPEAEQTDGPTFDAPWQARAFGTAVVLNQSEDTYEWKEFQQRLIDEVATDTIEGMNREAVYYQQWLTALERLVLEKGLVSREEIDRRTAEFATGDRDASEFITGEHDKQGTLVAETGAEPAPDADELR
jgi:nitrile hydratase accessory protein